VEAAIDGPASIAIDEAGNLYLTSPNENRIYKVGTDGILRVIAGTGLSGYGGDGGPATSAALAGPWGIAVDSKGNVYVADQLNRRVRRISPDGRMSTVTGDGTEGYSGDGGPARDAKISIPQTLAVDANDNLYVSEHSRIRKISVDGLITTLSQTAGGGSIAADAGGNLYAVGSNRVSRITPAGSVTVIAGNGKGGPTTAGQATGVPLGGPNAVAVDHAGVVYVSTGYGRIWKVANGQITAHPGSVGGGRLGDGGPARSAQFRGVFGLAADRKGNLYVADSGNHQVRKINTSGVIGTVAGNGISGYRGDGGPAVSAQLEPGELDVAVDAADNIYVSDRCRIRKVTPSGRISTVAGTGVCAFSGDGGPAMAAHLNHLAGTAVDAAGNLYIADTQNNRIRRVSPDGIITTFAGNGTEGVGGDGGPAMSAQLRFPKAVATDAAGNVYIADGRIRKVDPNGIITTLIAGAGGYGGAVTEALKGPESVLVDARGDVYVADTNNFRIRRRSADGLLSTVAGTGQLGFSGDNGPALNAQFNFPRGVAVDRDGNVYIADSHNCRVRKVTPDGIIRTFAGTGLESGFIGPSPGAQLCPGSIAVDSAGNVYAGDVGRRRVWKITPDGVIRTAAGQTN
jgi:sugar lactone lactonase YvrE